MTTQTVNCDLDFGGNSKALNLPAPSSLTEPARLGDVVPAIFASNTIAWASTITLDLSVINATVRSLSLAGATTFITAGLAHGRSVQVVLSGDTLDRGVTFPAAWKFFGTARPTTLAAGKEAILLLNVVGGATDSFVKAVWAPQS